MEDWVIQFREMRRRRRKPLVARRAVMLPTTVDANITLGRLRSESECARYLLSMLDNPSFLMWILDEQAERQEE